MSGLELVRRDLSRLGRSASWTKQVLKVGRGLLQHSGRSPRALRRKHALSYLSFRAGVLAPTSYELEVRLVETFLSSLVRVGLLDVAPELGLRARRAEPGPRLLLSEDTARALLTAEPPEGRGPHDRALALRDRAGLETLYGIVARAAKRAGRRAHPHAFRRAVATHLVRADVPVAVVQRLLGHRKLETTAAYVAVSPEELRRVVARLDWPR